ncbi:MULTISPECIES: hypothetical protein [Burkholderia]|jgi:hypothetical protein|uniref:Uncharacterized protein n=3 Tax=Burkholderia cepacia complex TaxID=87882 RepID=A0AAP2HJP7_9BURK|nr:MULTISPECIES: hypothetical protein [Burkholderia]KIS47017.1 hypothetical protein NP88_4560 [Burkholderia cepacia]ERI27251.1 hypothetical protein BURCENBC7_AP7653 [Burkholderia cenocepacia BC7]MBU9347390.1 hypothetical protein [Burkholderia multivorans]MBU9357403.1 hypothetical protein [Burkholderia multivorans]MBU9366674.1 hypothetical protein [Burkholderia multivorans]
MNTNDDNKLPSTSSDAQRLVESLDALQPSKQQQKVLLFEKAYLAIERAIGREVPQKQIVEELEKSGLRLSMGGFRSLLEAERKQRKETGERVRCERCGSNLPHVNDEGSQTNATT